jgi:cytochrome o ubiquinol oxidase operon protein cyoD
MNPMENNIQSKHKSHPVTLSSYIVGFVLSIVLTLAAYVLVQIHINSTHELISHAVLIPSVLGLAIVQFIVQLIFFLHLGSGQGSRWKLVSFLLTLGIVCIVVIGAIWIMNHLNYNMMASPDQMNSYIQSQDGL